MSKIKSIKAREILDSRGNPTIEVELETEDGKFSASVPSGVSKGKYEAVELRDGGQRYKGMGVQNALKNIIELIGPKIIGKGVSKQKEIDDLMKELDGTANKEKLGANAILAVSLAVCRAGAGAKKVPLYQYIAELAENGSLPVMPFACFNIINGGAHAGNDLDFQEFMIVPYAGISEKFQSGRPAESGNRPQSYNFSDNLRIAAEVYHNLKETLDKNYGQSAVNLGDEGGFAPPLNMPEKALDSILRAIRVAGAEINIGLILDCAASAFFDGERYTLKTGAYTRDNLTAYLLDLASKYPIIGFEDPFSEDDWDGWRMLSEKCQKQNKNLLIIGDDVLAANLERIRMAKIRGALNSMILKPNQIGTISETIEAAKIAKSFGWRIIVSHRSGETTDDFIADLAVGIGADFIKAGAPARGERVAKYNRLLRIEEELNL